MAQYYLLPRNLIKRFPFLRQLTWRIESGVLGGLLGIVRLLPLPWANRVTGTLFASFGPRTSKAANARRNLAVAFPAESRAGIERLTRDTFRHLGMSVAELIHIGEIWKERDRRLEFVVMPGASPPQAGRPTVYVTAHVGAWQVGNLVSRRYGITMPIIYAPESNPYLDKRLRDLRRSFEVPLVSRDGGLRVLMRELNKGNSIGLAVDTRLDGGEPLSFFGHDAMTNTAPARLALRGNCDMIPVLTERMPGARYRISIHPPIRPTDPDAPVAEQARDMTCQLNALFEQWIRALPGQWICLKRRWPKEVYGQKR